MINRIKSLLESIPLTAECLYCIINDPNHYIPLIEEEWVENIWTFDTSYPYNYLRFCFPLSYIIKTKVDINSLSKLKSPKLVFILRWDYAVPNNFIQDISPKHIRTKNGDQNIKLYIADL